MTAFLIRCCGDIPIDSGNLVFYLKSRNCDIRSPYRPFDEIEKNVMCTIIDLRKEISELSPPELMDTGYDAGCADVARIPLILLMDETSKVPDEWLICNHVYRANIDNIKEVVEIFVKSVHKYQKEVNISKRADIVARRALRGQIINNVNESIDKVSKFINEKKEKL